MKTDLRPFVRAIQAGAPVIMTAHLDIQALDPWRPGSLSPEVVQGLLRDTFGFEGVAVTDSQGMGPIYEPLRLRRGRRPVACSRATISSSTHPNRRRLPTP